MSGSTYTIAEGRTIDEFLAVLCRKREVFGLEAGDDDQYHLVRNAAWDGERMTLGAYRQIEPLKSIFFPPREFFGATLDESHRDPLPERIVVGVKNCDLAGLKIQDHIFGELPPGDPGYLEAREKTFIVTCDCTDCREACFCPIVGQRPYAESGFDINLSPVSDAYLVEAGSSHGEQRLSELSEFLEVASETLLRQRQDCREALTERLVAQSTRHGLEPGMDLAAAVRGAKDRAMWGEIAVDCVECGACNFTCCTCHCFQLVDGIGKDIDDGVAVRGKQWDGCLLMNFARVAGGANPRAGRAKRLQNRFLKKFDYFPEVLDCYACDGCGRCTEVCTGNIDIRDVLKRAADETESLHADSGHD
jgi:hypothetical protein